MRSIITIRCPSTGREIPSGILADAEAFSSLPVEVQVTCPACGGVHTSFTPSALSKEYRWKAGYWAAQAALVEWPHTRALWQTMQQSYQRLAELEATHGAETMHDADPMKDVRAQAALTL